jgi:zinc and cadmium transporter
VTLWLWTLGSVLVVSAVSFVGLVFLSRGAARLDTLLMSLVSLAAGVLLGGAFFHLIPEAWEIHGNSVVVPLWILAGFLGFFFLERFLWAHHHGHGEEPLPGRDPAREGVAWPVPEGSKDGGGRRRLRPVVVMSLVGDGLHNLIDGMIIAAAFGVGVPLGLVTTGAVLLHELPQEAGEFGVLVRGGLTPKRALLLNFVSASLAFVGALVVLLTGLATPAFIAALIPITAGNFIYIAAADLIPELHHEHDRAESVLHGALLLLGVVVMFVLRATTHGAIH